MLTLKRHALPQSAQAWHDMDAPLVRQLIDGDTCRIIGKVFSWSPLYFDVAILVGEKVVRRKVSKRSVHLEPCDRCPPR